MAKLFFYIGVLLASLLSAGSGEKPDASGIALRIQSVPSELINSFGVRNLLNESFSELRKQ